MKDCTGCGTPTNNTIDVIQDTEKTSEPKPKPYCTNCLNRDNA